MRTHTKSLASYWLSAIRERAEDVEGVFPVPRLRVKLWSFTYHQTPLLCPKNIWKIKHVWFIINYQRIHLEVEYTKFTIYLIKVVVVYGSPGFGEVENKTILKINVHHTWVVSMSTLEASFWRSRGRPGHTGFPNASVVRSTQLKETYLGLNPSFFV